MKLAIHDHPPAERKAYRKKSDCSFEVSPDESVHGLGERQARAVAGFLPDSTKAVRPIQCSPQQVGERVRAKRGENSSCGEKRGYYRARSCPHHETHHHHH